MKTSQAPSTASSAATPPLRAVDAIDERIIALVTADARLPLKTIAATVGLARSSVRQRLMKLEASHVILGYHARVACPDRVSAMLQVQLAKTPDLAVVAAVTRMAEVRRCYSLSGTTDLSIELEAATTTALNAARDRIAMLPGVAGVVTALILNRDKDA